MSDQKTYELTTTGWAYGGETIGRLPDNRIVFVPFTIPGETVRIQLIEDKRGFARAAAPEIITYHPDRITPRCIHYANCGGCHYQHLSYERQLEAKTAALRDTLTRIGQFTPEDLDSLLRPFVPAVDPWHYRNHIQFHLDDHGRLGYLNARSDEILAIQECHLPEGVLNEIWPQLDFEPIPSLERIGLRAGAEDEVMLVLETEDDEGLEFSLDIPMSAVQIGPNSLHVLSDSAEMEMTVLDYTFQVSAGSFFQVHTQMAAAMVEHLLDRLPLTPESTVLDVYCGVGLFSAFLAPQVGRLIGIEENPLAVEDFAENLDAFDHIEIYEAPAEDVLPTLEIEADLILVDPPRAGLALPALDAIIAMRPKMLAYVSCDPATFARDAKRLRREGFTVTEITPFDMFPQTYHIETISLWQGPASDS
jgi:23S rRNA (uracil1939-C5)-methyltransferase